MEFIFVIAIVALAIWLLRGFDQVAGRGPKQVKDGVNDSVVARPSTGRVPCPYCAEMILPAAKICPFCKSDLAQLEKNHGP